MYTHIQIICIYIFVSLFFFSVKKWASIVLHFVLFQRGFRAKGNGMWTWRISWSSPAWRKGPLQVAGTMCHRHALRDEGQQRHLLWGGGYEAHGWPEVTVCAQCVMDGGDKGLAPCPIQPQNSPEDQLRGLSQRQHSPASPSAQSCSCIPQCPQHTQLHLWVSF